MIPVDAGYPQAGRTRRGRRTRRIEPARGTVARHPWASSLGSRVAGALAQPPGFGNEHLGCVASILKVSTTDGIDNSRLGTIAELDPERIGFGCGNRRRQLRQAYLESPETCDDRPLGSVRTLGEQEEAGISQDQEALRIVRFDVVSLGHGSASPRLAVEFRRNVGAKSARLVAGTRGSLPGGRQDPASVSVCRHAPDRAGIAATGPRVLLYWARGLLNSV